MNFRRGLFRLWIVFACVVIFGVAVASYGEIANEFKQAKILARNPPPSGYVVDNAPAPWALLFSRLAIALVIPASVFGAGMVLGWAFSGFLKTDLDSK